MLPITLIGLLTVASLLVNGKAIKDRDVSITRRVLALVVVLIHDLFYTMVIGAIVYSVYCILKKKSIVRTLLALNLIVATSIVLFLSLNICILTLWFNKLLRLHRYTLYTYVPAMLIGKVDRRLDRTGQKNYVLWTRSYLVVISVLLLLNSCALILNINK